MKAGAAQQAFQYLKSCCCSPGIKFRILMELRDTDTRAGRALAL